MKTMTLITVVFSLFHRIIVAELPHPFYRLGPVPFSKYGMMVELVVSVWR